jgi:hypothetical protein
MMAKPSTIDILNITDITYSADNPIKIYLVSGISNKILDVVCNLSTNKTIVFEGIRKIDRTQWTIQLSSRQLEGMQLNRYLIDICEQFSN